ncbi:transcriptional regulatory protein [Candidatus Phaeomarinobacter ectocarpi]|uniref:Transcriptional regulatory protein n=1 Tax=Candidatus Phaeomarinibacter ectocarpi TaxID=1458461 RepID=X5MMN0_9HYPH|nr:helix-turn-helix transcriptional regulator [Candidatus Phaeomarinobacter ectocarpi]CDO60560.1 transcriptional regulatory protein [Candidatus Phaeomarinobacter ectocarpi]
MRTPTSRSDDAVTLLPPASRLLAQIGSFSSYNQVVNVLEAILQSMGVDGVLYFSCRREAWATAQSNDYLITTRGPRHMKPYEAMYLWKGYKDTDLALAAIAKATAPFTTAEVYTPDKVTRDQKDLVDLTEHYHLNFDLFVPVHTPGRIQVVYFFVLGDNEADEARISVQRQDLIDLARVFALVVHEFIGIDLEQVPNVQLSVRELECLSLLGSGSSNPEMAKSLNISERTIKFHVKNLMKKLGASSRLEVVAIAARTNLMSN